jgi:hypothetical protein
MSEPYCPNAVDDGGVIRYCESPPGHTGDHLHVVVWPGDVISRCEVIWPNTDTP